MRARRLLGKGRDLARSTDDFANVAEDRLRVNEQGQRGLSDK
jgi:hypothetical protein